MAALHAVQTLHDRDRLTATEALAAHARRIGGLGDAYEQSFLEYAERLNDTTQRVERELSDALCGVSERIVTQALGECADVRDAQKLEEQMANLRAQELEQRGNAIEKIFHPLETWAADAKRSLRGHIDAVRSVTAAAECISPIVLLIDDDTLQRRVISRTLSDAGYIVDSYASSVEGLQAVRDRRPDVVLMEYALKDFNGIEVMRRMRYNKHMDDVPIAIVSSHSNTNVVKRCRKAGAVDFLVKPVEPATLLSKIRAIVKSPAQSSMSSTTAIAAGPEQSIAVVQH